MIYILCVCYIRLTMMGYTCRIWYDTSSVYQVLMSCSYYKIVFLLLLFFKLSTKTSYRNTYKSNTRTNKCSNDIWSILRSDHRFTKVRKSLKGYYQFTFNDHFAENCDLRYTRNNNLKIQIGAKQSVICNWYYIMPGKQMHVFFLSPIMTAFLEKGTDRDLLKHGYLSSFEIVKPFS